MSYNVVDLNTAPTKKTFINACISRLKEGSAIEKLEEQLATWSTEEQTTLLSEIFQKLCKKIPTYTQITAEKWASALRKSYHHEKVPIEVTRLFWQTMYDNDPFFAMSSAFIPNFCSNLRFHIISHHFDAIKEEYHPNIHLEIVYYIRQMTDKESLLGNQSIPAKYRYFALTHMAPDVREEMVNKLPSIDQAGFNVSQPYQMEQLQRSIFDKLWLLQEKKRRLYGNNLQNFDRACESFRMTWHQYQEGQIDAQALLRELDEIFSLPEIKPILETHSEWYKLLLDIAINIVIISSIVGLVALTVYRFKQGFQHGFFIHNETNRQRLEKDLRATITTLPEGNVFNF